MKLGAFELSRVSDGTFWLDGGAMFGVVPRVIWEKQAPPDEKNRIELGLNCLLVRTDERNILIDTGCGQKYSEKEIRIYGMQQAVSLSSELARLGLSPDEIDLVILTHLHFDHCGGCTRFSEGVLEPVFPRAEFLVQKREFEDANSPNERNRASYFSENWEVLYAQGRLRLIEGECQAAPGIVCLPTPGHTLGHQSVKIESEGRVCLFIGDLCPTSVHVPLAWIMGYDLFPLTTLETRRRIYREAVERDWLVFFEHDPVSPAGYLSLKNGKYGVNSIDWVD